MCQICWPSFGPAADSLGHGRYKEPCDKRIWFSSGRDEKSTTSGGAHQTDRRSTTRSRASRATPDGELQRRHMKRERNGVWQATEGEHTQAESLERSAQRERNRPERIGPERIDPARAGRGLRRGLRARHRGHARAAGPRPGDRLARVSGIGRDPGHRIEGGAGDRRGRDNGGRSRPLRLGTHARRGDDRRSDRRPDRDREGPARAGRGGVQRTKSARQHGGTLGARRRCTEPGTQGPGHDRPGTHDGGATA